MPHLPLTYFWDRLLVPRLLGREEVLALWLVHLRVSLLQDLMPLSHLLGYGYRPVSHHRVLVLQPLASHRHLP